MNMASRQGMSIRSAEPLLKEEKEQRISRNLVVMLGLSRKFIDLRVWLVQASTHRYRGMWNQRKKGEILTLPLLHAVCSEW